MGVNSIIIRSVIFFLYFPNFINTRLLRISMYEQLPTPLHKGVNFATGEIE